MAKRTLTTPISMPNITKIECIKVQDDRDDPVPSFTLVIHLEGVGGRDGGTHTVICRNAVNSTGLNTNAAPAGFGDVVLGGVMQIDNACTLVGDAYDAAPGARAAKREAAMAKAMEIGLIGAGLAAT
jgi:hypothetical protein